MKHQTADLKAKYSAFLFPTTENCFQTMLASCTNITFDFVPTRADLFQPQGTIFTPTLIFYIIKIVSQSNIKI
ncbi:MAG: hypothetical protein JWQ09_235 [Segetibacter sp.]|nr:hypothetical protein [Segetibacter sp.]